MGRLSRTWAAKCLPEEWLLVEQCHAAGKEVLWLPKCREGQGSSQEHTDVASRDLPSLSSSSLFMCAHRAVIKFVHPYAHTQICPLAFITVYNT